MLFDVSGGSCCLRIVWFMLLMFWMVLTFRVICVVDIFHDLFCLILRWFVLLTFRVVRVVNVSDGLGF